MRDIFAELDASNPPANVGPTSTSSSSDIFSSMDAEKKPEGSSLIRRGIGDPLVGLARGTAVGIPETAFGLLDIPTLGYAGKTAEAVGKGLGIGGFKEGREFFNKMLTPETQEAQRKVSEAEGFVDTVKTAVQNPSSIIQVVTESIPAMLTGTRLIGAGQKALGYGLKETGALAGKELLAVEASNKAKQIVTGALGEAAVTAGQNIESVRQETEDKLLTPMQIGINVASAAVTGIIGTLGGKLANRLGIEDINTLMAGGMAGKNKKALLKGLLYGAFQEGALEELPQSMQEQIAQNISLGKPINDQIFEQGAIGLLAGMVQATGAQAAGGLMQQLRARDVNQQNIDQQLSEMPPEVQEAVGGLDGNVTANQLNVERQVATEVEKANAAIDQAEQTVEQQAEQTVTSAEAPTEVVPAAIPEAIRTEVAAMSDRNLAITAEKDREPIVRQAAAEEIQKRAAAPAAAPAAAAPVEKPAAAPSDIVMKTLEGKTQTQLDTLANEQPDTPIGIAARTLWNKNATNAERILKEKEQATAPAAAEKIDYEAQAAAKGISLDNFKKVQNIGELNKWAKEGVEGAQIELARRAQEGLIQPEQITWKAPEVAEAPQTVTPPAAEAPAALETKTKVTAPAIPSAAAFGQEVTNNASKKYSSPADLPPTPAGKIRLYHGTKEENVESILKNGLLTGFKAGKGEKIGEILTNKEFSEAFGENVIVVDVDPKLVDGMNSKGQWATIARSLAPEDIVGVVNKSTKKKAGTKQAKKKGEAKYGTRDEAGKETGRQTAGGPSTGKERDSVLSEVQKRHERRVGTLRQVILADASSPADIRKAAGTEGGIVFYPEGYNDPEFQKASDVAGKYGMEAIPIFSESGSINGMVHRGYVYINMAGGADTTTMETVYHEISHAKGNAETQAKVDTESDAFVQFRTTYSKIRTGKKDILLPIALVLDEYAAELDSGVKVRFGVNLADGLKPGTSVLPLSESATKIKASDKVKNLIVEDHGIIKEIYEIAKDNPNGFTIDTSAGKLVKTGYAVSPAKETATVIDDLDEDVIRKFLYRFQSIFETDKRAFFGGWKDEDPKSPDVGKWVLDVSFVVDNREDAVYIGDIGGQDGIYHIDGSNPETNYFRTDEAVADLKARGLYDEGRRAELRGIRRSLRSIIQGQRPDQRKIDYSVRGTARPARTAGQLANRGRTGEVQGQIRIDSGVHWSSQPRKELDSKYYGTGLADATSRRLPSDPKSPLRHRIHFYYNPGTGMPPPEVGVGPYAHDVDLSKYKIFDLSSGAIKISQVEGEDWRNTLEKAILKAGFDGFANPDYGVAVLLGKRKVAVQPVEEARYSLRELIPEWLNTTIGAGLATFTTNPQGLPRSEVEKVADELKTHKDFSKIEYALSVPARMAQKHPNTWGKLYRIFAVDREETRDELRHEFQKMAEPFLMYDQQLRKKKVSKEEIAASMGRVQRAIIAGDAIAVEFTDEQLTEGINDKYGQEVKLNKDEIAAYRSVRNTLRHIRTVLVNHLANQSLRGYRRNKWFRILEAAMKGDSLNAETIQTLLDKKGMKQAALDRAKKLQPDITKIFERIEAGVDKIPPQEIAKAGKAYEKIANSMQAELTTLQGYVSELTGVTDKTELSAMTREIFSAYMQTRPQMKVIRALRNEVGSLDGYFPRFRETGDKKFRVYLQELDENGNIVIDEKTGKEARKEVYMGMFSNARQGNDIIRDAMKKLKIKESDLTPDGKFPPQYYVEIARQTASPESAYQGVNDINLQRIFDDAMRAAQEKGVHGLDATYTDANGNEVNVFEQIRQAGLQSLTNHLKARGAMQRSIKRSEDLIEGYQETGLQRVLLDYITSMSGLMTKQVAASEAMELLSTIKDPFLFASMSRYTREMLRNNSLADRISGYTRAAAFTYFLGGLLKSAVVNMTQNPIVGFAELGKFMREHKLGGAGKSDVLYAKAMKDVLSGNLTADEKAFIDKMVNRGIATNQFIQAVFDNVMNKGLRRHIAVMNFMAKPFSMSEVFNRKSAAIAMYRAAYDMRLAQAKASGLTGAAAATEAERMTFDDARDFVTNVHYAYGKTNRPLPIMTGDALGAVASSLYTFKGFSHNFLARQAELLSKGDFRTLGHTLAYLVLFGGLSTFPFLRDLFDWWEKEYGYNPMNQVRASLRGIGGETLEKFGVSGLPSVLGANFSGSLAVGLPWPIGASSPEDSIFGVWAGVATKAKRSAEALSHGDLNRGITEISPEFMRAPRVAIRESEVGKQLFGAPGYATNIRGHAILGEDGKPISLSSWEAALKALGFNPTEYARAKEKTQNVVRQVAWVNDLKQNVAERYRSARLNNDKDAVKDMMANVKEVNQKIRSRNLQQLVTPLKISNVMKSAMPKIGAKERREMLYKRQVL